MSSPVQDGISYQRHPSLILLYLSMSMVPPGSGKDLTSCLTCGSSLPACPPVLSGPLCLAFFFSCCDKCVYSGIRVWTVVFVPALSLAWHSWRHTKSGLITQGFPVCPGLRLAARTRTREGEKQRRKENRKQSMRWCRHVRRQRHILGCSKFSMHL